MYRREVERNVAVRFLFFLLPNPGLRKHTHRSGMFHHRPNHQSSLSRSLCWHHAPIYYIIKTYYENITLTNVLARLVSTAQINSPRTVQRFFFRIPLPMTHYQHNRGWCRELRIVMSSRDTSQNRLLTQLHQRPQRRYRTRKGIIIIDQGQCHRCSVGIGWKRV